MTTDQWFWIMGSQEGQCKVYRILLWTFERLLFPIDFISRRAIVVHCSNLFSQWLRGPEELLFLGHVQRHAFQAWEPCYSACPLKWIIILIAKWIVKLVSFFYEIMLLLIIVIVVVVVIVVQWCGKLLIIYLREFALCYERHPESMRG